MLRNTPGNYGAIAKWLHWSIAVLFLASYCAVYYRQWFTVKDTPENWIALQLHLSVGITIAAFVVLRILWRITNRPPEPEPGSRLAHAAAHAGHMALYVIMVVMVVTGYIGTGVDTEYFFVFDIPKFESTGAFTLLVTQGLGVDFETFEAPVDLIHKDILGAWLVWLLILGHVLAALYHHYVRGDRTLRKMTTGR